MCLEFIMTGWVVAVTALSLPNGGEREKAMQIESQEILQREEDENRNEQKSNGTSSFFFFFSSHFLLIPWMMETVLIRLEMKL